jgi:hypothetical protein
MKTPKNTQFGLGRTGFLSILAILVIALCAAFLVFADNSGPVPSKGMENSAKARPSLWWLWLH